jgi:hypothetical protein
MRRRLPLCDPLRSLSPLHSETLIHVGWRMEHEVCKLTRAKRPNASLCMIHCNRWKHRTTKAKGPSQLSPSATVTAVDSDSKEGRTCQ